MRAVDRDGKTRRTGQCSGDQTHEARCVDSYYIFKYQTCKTGGTDNQQRQYNQRLPFRAKGTEESGARLYANGENEQYQTEISQFLRNDYPEMPEQESDKDNG